MPHSPYILHVEPPVSDLDFATSKHDFQRIRWERDEGLDDRFALETTLHSGELLIEQCEFLEAKLTIKKRENFQLITQSEALAEKVVTLELECSGMKDENRGYKEELAALKAKLGMEIEQLQKENKAYKEELAAVDAMLEKEKLAAVDAMLEKDKLASPTNQYSIIDDQASRPDDKAGDTDKATEPAAVAEGEYGRYKCVASEPGTYATWCPVGAPVETPVEPLKRGRVSNPTFDQQPPHKVRRMAASLKGPGEEDSTYIGGSSHLEYPYT